MKKVHIYIITIFAIIASNKLYSQSSESGLHKVFRVNILNPGIEYEFPVLNKSVVSTNLGLGLGYPYSSLDQTGRGNGFVFMLTPFLDLEYKHLYNYYKRKNNNKNTQCNSANYIGMRLLTRGNTIIEYNMYRPNDFDFVIAPVWGLQRSNTNIYYSMDFGLGYAFDSDNSGVVFLVQMSLGLNLKKYCK